SLGASQNITVNSNHIQGSRGAGLNVAAGAYTGTLDATNNYWGSFTGPTTPANPAGTGDRIIDSDGVVTFAPFLTSGIDAAPGPPGFQPSANLPQVSVSVAFGPFGEVILLTGPDGTLTQFDAFGAHVLGGGIRSASIAFGPAGEVILVTTLDGTLTQFD